MGPVGAKTEEEEEGGCASNRPRNEREKEVGHPSPLDTRHLRARTRTLWLARVRANLGPSGSRGGWPPDWTNSSNRTYTRPLSLARSCSLPPSLPARENPFQSTTSFRSRSRSREQWSIGFRLSLANIPCSFYGRFYCFRYPISINQLAPSEGIGLSGVNKSFFNNS